MEYVNEEELFAPRADTPHGMPEDDVELGKVGWVRVRALTRDEVAAAQQKGERGGWPATERAMVAMGMINPSLTEAKVGRWQMTGLAGEIERAGNKISELSGLTEGAEKAAYESFRNESGAGVRALPSDTARDDGGAAAPDGQ